MEGFVNPTYDNKIYLCNDSAIRGPDNHIVETLVHEAAHIAFRSSDECFVSKWEVAAMLRGLGSLGFVNGYLEKCGISY